MKKLSMSLAALLFASSAYAQTSGNSITLPQFNNPSAGRSNPVLRQIVAGTKFSDGYNGANYTQGCGVSSFVVKSHAAQNTMQIVLANSYLSAGSGEQVIPGTINYKVSYQVNGGTIIPVTFGGQASANLTGSVLGYSDPLQSYPVGSVIKVAILETNTGSGGIPFDYSSSDIWGSAARASLGTPSAITDCTQNMVVTAQAGGIGIFPAAIIGLTTDPAVYLFGDSRFSAVADVRNDGTVNGGIARTVGVGYSYINSSDPGDTIAGATTNNALRRSLMAYTTTMFDEYGVNSIYGGATPATVIAARTTIAGYYAPYGQVIGVTLEPETQSSDNWAVTANQTTYPAYEPNRVSFNNSVRSGIVGESAVYDEDRAVDPTGSGLWTLNGTAKAITPDGVHGTGLVSIMEKLSGQLSAINLDAR